MYCNKVKKGKHCIIYMLELNLTKLNLDCSSSARRIFQSSVVKTLPCSGCFTACMSTHFPIVKLGYADRMSQCDMVPNGVADSIKFQLTSLRGTEVLACSFDTDFNYGLFDNNLCNKGDGRAYSRKEGHACGITQKGQKSPVKGHSCGFLPLIFSNLGHFEHYTP